MGIIKILLKVGYPVHLFVLDYNRFEALVTSCWIKDLWSFVSDFNISLNNNTPPLYPHHEHDAFLIPLFQSMGASSSQLQQLNGCCLALH
eukprot:14675959-Ditylum_brightwellii.AAC.1